MAFMHAWLFSTVCVQEAWATIRRSHEPYACGRVSVFVFVVCVVGHGWSKLCW